MSSSFDKCLLNNEKNLHKLFHNQKSMKFREMNVSLEHRNESKKLFISNHEISEIFISYCEKTTCLFHK